MARNIVNRFSSIPTDPLRGFKFYASFVPAAGSTTAFSTNILDASGDLSSQDNDATGKSAGFVGGFTQIGGLGMNIQNIAYREGGMNITPHQMPGQVTFTPVTFQRGVLYGNDQAMTWVKGLFASLSGTGIGVSKNASFRVDVKIYVASAESDKPDELTPRIGFKLKNAWITDLRYSDLNAGGNDLMFETMTLVHEGMIPFFTDANGVDVQYK